MNTYPRTFSHIGISVPNVEQAVEFYSKVMGWYQIMEPTVITEESDTQMKTPKTLNIGRRAPSISVSKTPM